jgi:hypothetical protein
VASARVLAISFALVNPLPAVKIKRQKSTNEQAFKQQF